MQTFLNNVVQDVLSKTDNLSNHTFILPSRRAGVFLKEQFKTSLSATTILPKIICIEEFITELSTINSIDTTTLLFEFYGVYKKHTPKKETDSFDQFSTVAMNRPLRPLNGIQAKPYAANAANAIGMIVAGSAIANEFASEFQMLLRAPKIWS